MPTGIVFVAAGPIGRTGVALASKDVSNFEDKREVAAVLRKIADELEPPDRISVARDAILDELKRRFQAGDKDVKPNDPDYHWHKPQKNYFSGAGTMLCPVCNAGALTYSRSSYNGHVLGRCATHGCVAWME